MAKRLAPLLILTALLCVAFPGNVLAASAAPPKEKGLLITPLRQYLSIDAGKTVQSSFTVANLTDDPLSVNFSIKQFSVTDYVYNYKFNNPTNKWVHLSTDSVTLRPNQSQEIPYSVQVPARSKPGGVYYTLFAGANLVSQGVNSTIQAADLLYLTVNGKLTQVSHLQSSSIQWVSFGHDISFSLQPVNTGNVYSFVYVSGELHGLFVKPPVTSAAHLLMPGKVRSLNGTIASPTLPGIYKATYGYKTDAGWAIQESHIVLFIPPWFIAFVLAAVLLLGKFLPRRRNSGGTDDGTTTDGLS